MTYMQPNRPWIVRKRIKSYRTERWGRWRTHATYASEDAARTSAANLAAGIEVNYCNAYVRHRNTFLPVRMDDAKHCDVTP